jgi:isopenicillin N synthase-like dioxygenase
VSRFCVIIRRKEGFEFARDIDPSVAPDNWFYEQSVWPDEDGSFPFKEFLTETYDYMHETAMEILRLTAIGMGIDEHAFEPIFSDKPCSTFRIIHYPPWDGPPPVSKESRLSYGYQLLSSSR